MSVLRKYRTLFVISGIGCLISGISFILMPLVDLNGTTVQKVFAIVTALLFWLGLITEILFFILANKQCNLIEETLIKKGSKSFKKTKIGLIAFFSCREAIVVDILMLISLIALIIFVVFKVTNDWLFTIFMVVLFFSFNLHCFFNGKNYKYLKEIQKFLKKQGAKKDE